MGNRKSSASRFGHLREYLEGTGATGALVAGATVVFLSLAAFLAFKGLPFGGSGGDIGSAYIGANGSGPPEQASLTLGAAPRAVASRPVRGAALVAGTRAGLGNVAARGGAVPVASIVPGVEGLVPPPTTPPQPPPPGILSRIPPPPKLPGSPDVPTLEQGLAQALNGFGAAVGRPGLGDQVEQAASNITSGLPGSGSGN